MELFKLKVSIGIRPNGYKIAMNKWRLEFRRFFEF